MKTIQIFSPHIDDAIFSLGGSILNWHRKGLNIRIHNVFTISNWTSPNPLSGVRYQLNLDEVTALRKKEEREAGEYAKFNYEFWDFLDLPLRKEFSIQQNQSMEKKILNKIADCLSLEDSFFFPLGIDHPDHLIINRIGNSFTNNGYNIFYYEDMPYFSWGNFDYKKAYSDQIRCKMPVLEKINYEEKTEVLKIYSSQVTKAFLKSIRTYSYNLADNNYYERYWKQR